MDILDRDSRIALHHQIYDIFMNKIKTGELKPGDRIPSERQLSETYGVSQTTVKQAVQCLVQDGYVFRERGRGTFVKEPLISRPLNSVMSFSEEIAHLGKNPSVKILDRKVISASEEIAKAMNLRYGEQLILYRRLRLADGQVLGIQSSYLPYSMFGQWFEQNMITGKSLYEDIEKQYGVRPTRAIEEYQIVRLEKKEVSLMGLSKTEPAFGVRRWSYLANGTLMEYTESLLRGDKYKLKVELTSRQRDVQTRVKIQ
jgi:GntR family transcriptional regulator